MLIEADGLLFDLDGVLVDSVAAIERHWRQFATWYGLDEHRLLEEIHGRRAVDIITSLGPALPVAAAEAIERYEELEIGDQLGVVALPGAMRLIAQLPLGSWAVVTSGTSDVAMARMKAAGLEPPAVLICADDVPAGKPDPAPYRHGAGRLGLRVERALAVEDAPLGLASALAAGCKTLALSTTHRPDELLAANCVCKDLTAVQVARTEPGRLLLSVDCDEDWSSRP